MLKRGDLKHHHLEGCSHFALFYPIFSCRVHLYFECTFSNSTWKNTRQQWVIERLFSRWYAIAKPMEYPKHVTQKRSMVVLAGIWVVSMVPAALSPCITHILVAHQAGPSINRWARHWYTYSRWCCVISTVNQQQTWCIVVHHIKSCFFFFHQ